MRLGRKRKKGSERRRGEGEGGGGKGNKKEELRRGCLYYRCALETTEHHYLMLYMRNRDRKPVFHISTFSQQQRLSYIFLVPTLKSMFKAAWMDINMSEGLATTVRKFTTSGQTELVIGGGRKQIY